MTAKLAVTVAVDMDAAAVTLRPAGTLTPENTPYLLAVAQRAKHVLPGFDVLLDLDQLHIGSPAALRALSDSGALTLHPRRPRHGRGGYRHGHAARAAA